MPTTTFGGANIRGAQGGMPQASVESDLTELAKRCHVLAVQEFQNTWYWLAAQKVLAGWASSPPMSEGSKSKTAAIKGGQAIFWRADLFELVDEYVVPAFAIEKPNLGVMADRWFRAALLRDLSTGFTAWYCSGHNAVSGDKANSPAANRDFLDQNLKRWDDFLAHLVGTGCPVVGEIDANISHASPRFADLKAIFDRHGATLHGELGIEYAFTIDGAKGKTGPVTDAVVLPRTRKGGVLFTDHETRLLTFTGSMTTAPTPTPRPVPTPAPEAPVSVQPLKVPFIAARWHGGAQTPRAVVIHATVSPCKPGNAKAVANFFRTHGQPTSAHYTVDPAEVIQSVGDHTVAYHCGYNTGSIAFELSDPQTGPGSRWGDSDHKAMLDLAARSVAQTCLAYGIETRHVTVTELKAKGPHGIYSHDDSRRAFGKTTHTDPGPDFPWVSFMAAVNRHAADLHNPTPARQEPTVNRMGQIQALLKAIIDDPATTKARRLKCQAAAKLLPKS